MIGYGMATATYPANRSAAQAVVRMLPGGKMFVGSGTQDLGTGTYTIMAQQAAAGLGIDPSLVEVKLGDSTLPKAPVSGGSQSSASVIAGHPGCNDAVEVEIGRSGDRRCSISLAWAEDAGYRGQRRQALQQEQSLSSQTVWWI